MKLSCPPRIYKKLSDDYSYFLKPHEQHWIRTIDFTLGSHIRQSSAYCFSLPPCKEFPNLRDCFREIYKEESQTELLLEDGVPFSEKQHLVPIVEPPEGLILPYNLLFKVCALVHRGRLFGPNLGPEFFNTINPENHNRSYIHHAHSLKCRFHPNTLRVDRSVMTADSCFKQEH